MHLTQATPTNTVHAAWLESCLGMRGIKVIPKLFSGLSRLWCSKA